MLTYEKVNIHRGKKRLLEDISLEVKDNEIYGIIGPKNSGKTAVCKVAAGLIYPDTGKVFLNGKEIQSDSALRWEIGYLPEQLELFKYQQVIEYLIFFAQLYRMDAKEAKDNAFQILENLEMLGLADNYLTSLSKGEIQKLGIGRCLLHKPKLLILDDIFNGLDPIASLEIQSILQRLHSFGITILFTSSNLGNAAKLCSQVAIMDSGKIVANGTLAQIQHLKQSANPIMIRVESSMETAIQLLRNNPKISTISRKDNLLSVRLEGEDGQEAELLTELIQNQVMISAFYREESDFESLFLRITNG